MAVETKKSLAVLPESWDTRFDLRFVKEGGGATLEFLSTDDGHLLGGLSFKRVRATRSASESLSDSWHISGAYQTLVEIVDSTWVAGLKASEIDFWHPRHFLIYVEDYGYYELLASEWAWIGDGA